MPWALLWSLRYVIGGAVLMAGIWFYLEHRDSVAEARGAAKVQARWDAEKDQIAKAVKKEEVRQVQVVEKVVVQYRDRIKVVKEKGLEIVRQVPVYVPVDSCPLPSGWRVLHDSAVSGSLPDDSAGALAAALPVEASTAAETVAENYAGCRADQARLVALQQLVVQLQPERGDP